MQRFSMHDDPSNTHETDCDMRRCHASSVRCVVSKGLALLCVSTLASLISLKCYNQSVKSWFHRKNRCPLRPPMAHHCHHRQIQRQSLGPHRDRKSTRLNSSHLVISYAVFCLKKKNIHHHLADVRPARAVPHERPRRRLPERDQSLGLRIDQARGINRPPLDGRPDHNGASLLP